MTGKELAERLRQQRPGIHVLYMSGHSDDVIAHRGVLDPGVAYIAKPFTPERLARKVRAVLGPPRSGGKVLVVDDEPGIRRFLRSVLERAGYKVWEAADGRQALQSARAADLDLVLTDLVMPEQEGIETIRILRRDLPELKIIAISGAFGGEFLKVAEKLGADAVLRKPIDPSLLLARLREVLPPGPSIH
jgi:CheY-like chemotaxis protein